MKVPPKCLRCSQAILDGDLVIFQHGDWIHARCWQIVASAEQVRESRQLTRRSREHLEQSKERVRRAWQIVDKPSGVLCAVCGTPMLPDDVVVANEGMVHRGCLSPKSS